MQADGPGKKSNVEKWKNFDLILEVSKLMTYDLHEEKRAAPCREKDRKRRDEKEGGKTLL